MYLAPNPEFQGVAQLPGFSAPGDAAISAALATFSNATAMGRNPLSWSFVVPGPSGLSGGAGLRPPPNIPLSTDGMSSFPVGMGSGMPETTRHAKQGNTATATFVPINSINSPFPPQGVAENLPLFTIRDPRVSKFVCKNVEIDPQHIKIGNLLFSPYTINKYIQAQQTMTFDPRAMFETDGATPRYDARRARFETAFSSSSLEKNILKELRRRDDDPLDTTMPEMDDGRHELFYYKAASLKRKTALIGICVNQVSAPVRYTHPHPTSAKTESGTDLTVTGHITGESQVRNFWGDDAQPGRHLWWMLDSKPSSTNPFRLAWVPFATETRQFPKDKLMFRDAFGEVVERPFFYQGFVRAWHYQISTGNMSDGLIGLDDSVDLTNALRGAQQLALLDVFVPAAR